MKTQKTKNTTMKTTLNFVIVAFVALALTISTTSCKKSNEEPAPAPSNNGGNNGNPNIAPAFDAISATVVSDGSAKSFALPVHDADGNTITISSITGASSNVTITKTGLEVTVTPNNSVYAGVETLTITITDGTTPTTATFTVNVGSSSQTSTYSILNNFFELGLSGLVGTSTLNTGNIVTTGTQPSGGFFNSAAAAGTYNYKILSGGNVEFTAGATTIEYTVQTSSGALVFTKVSNGTPYTLHQ